MLIVYRMDHDGHKRNQLYNIEPSLARRLCENNIAVPLPDWEKKKEKEKAALSRTKKVERATVEVKTSKPKPKPKETKATTENIKKLMEKNKRRKRKK